MCVHMLLLAPPTKRHTSVVGEVEGRLVAAGKLRAQRRLEHPQPEPHGRQRACGSLSLQAEPSRCSQHMAWCGKVGCCHAVDVRREGLNFCNHLIEEFPVACTCFCR